MSFDQSQVAQSFAFDADVLKSLRNSWLELLDLSVWGDLRSAKIGAVTRLRKRLLEVGEDMRSFVATRDWIPQPREQLKSGLGSSIKLRDSLLALDRAAALLDGGDDFAAFEKSLLAFRHVLLVMIERHEGQWASLLDTQYADEEE